ncbi:unnamed protein product [Urochloa decumbens]|uniref:Uncharacterized protein n=1 Tax=Urochloa decumbens TaxID=240449 RepID=A0ABC9BK88_9POAL
MADAADAALPPPPAPTPAWRSTAAALVRSPRAMVAAAATVLIFPILAMLWLLLVSMGARRIARAAWGEGSAVVTAADGVSLAASAGLVVLGLASLAAAVCSICVAAWSKQADKAPALSDLTTPEDQPVLCVLMFGMFANLAFLLLTLVGLLLITFSHVKGSHAERSGYVIMDVAVFSLLVLNCFIVLPAMALFVWKRMYVIAWQLI